MKVKEEEEEEEKEEEEVKEGEENEEAGQELVPTAPRRMAMSPSMCMCVYVCARALMYVCICDMYVFGNPARGLTPGYHRPLDAAITASKKSPYTLFPLVATYPLLTSPTLPMVSQRARILSFVLFKASSARCVFEGFDFVASLRKTSIESSNG